MGRSAIRINVLGASGSGASTLARTLAEALSLPCFDSDDYWHGPSDPPFRNPRSPEERCALMERDLAPLSGWILGGGVAGWDPEPRLQLTHVVFLHTATPARLERLRRREQERFGARVLPGGDMYEDHQAFIAWASRYDDGDIEGKTLARHEAWLAAQQCAVLRLDGGRPLCELTTAVLAALAIGVGTGG